MRHTQRGLDVNLSELNDVLARLRPILSAEDYQQLETAVAALRYLEELVADHSVTMAELRRRIVIHGGTEKTREVLRRVGIEASAPPAAAPEEPTPPHAGLRTRPAGGDGVPGRPSHRRAPSDAQGGGALPGVPQRQGVHGAGAQGRSGSSAKPR